jgi:hypothetical protein
VKKLDSVILSPPPFAGEESLQLLFSVPYIAGELPRSFPALCRKMTRKCFVIKEAVSTSTRHLSVQQGQPLRLSMLRMTKPIIRSHVQFGRETRAT